MVVSPISKCSFKYPITCCLCSILGKTRSNSPLALFNLYFSDEFEAPCYSEVGVNSFYKFANYENLKNEIENNDINILVATDYKKIIGVIAIKNKNHIAMLFVDKEYQKQGIGKKLIRVAKGEYNLNNYFI